MLLVDDHDAEGPEPDLLLDQGVGADDEIDRAVLQPVQQTGAVGPGRPIGQQLETQGPLAHQRGVVGHGQVGQQLTQAEMVLLSEDLGRGHQGPLVPALHGDEESAHCDHGLARADIALQQAVHGEGATEVDLDLADDALLGRGQRVGQTLVECPDQATTEVVDDPRRGPLQLELPAHQRHLDPEQLVEDESAPGLP